MKRILPLFLLSLPVYASKPIIGFNDLAFSKGTGVEKVQFLVGGPDQKITGAIDQDAIFKIFRSNMIATYRCYSQYYGPESEQTGQILVRVTLNGNARPTDVQLETKDLDSKDFTACIQEHWRKTEFIAPSDGKLAVIVMPITARARKR